MILRERVGGGGSAKSSLVMTGPETTCFLRDSSAGEGGDAGRYDESEPLAEDVDEVLARSSWNAVGGRLNVGATMLPSLPRMSFDEPGVGGACGRGIVATLAEDSAAGQRAWKMCLE